ncbi:MAG: hypothetical protein LWW93_16530 [Hyphomicrobiales bacterium]|nr:hypothetical protein [Hyphomicrobiales bacterium]
MPRHVLVRFLAPATGGLLGVVVFLLAPGTELVKILAGLAMFAAGAWIGDVAWKRGASREEIRRDLEERVDAER